MNTPFPTVWRLGLWAFLLTIVSTAFLHPQNTPPSELIVLNSNWEYHWGDFAGKGEGRFDWEAIENPEEEWNPISFPSNPPGRNKQKLLWLRCELPEVEVRDPRIFIYSVDYNAEFFIDTKLIHSVGEISPDGKGAFIGWPWNLIELPHDFGGKTLYVRVYSDYFDIGLWGSIFLGSAYDQIRRIFSRDNLRFFIGITSLLISIIFLAIYIFIPGQQSSLYLSMINLCLVIRVLSHTHIKQFVLNTPLLWEYIKTSSYFLIFVFITLFIQQFLEQRYQKITRILWISFLILLATVLILSLTGIVLLIHTYRILDGILIITVAVLAYLLIKASRGGDLEIRLITVNMFIMAALAVYSIMVSNSILPWIDNIDFIMVFIFSIGLVIILVRRFYIVYGRLELSTNQLQNRTNELKELNETLENTVAERTRQLEDANRRLEKEKSILRIISITDGLTKLYNRNHSLERFKQMVGEAKRYSRKLSIILFDIDHFKQVNDSYGHQIGDSVLIKVAGIFKSTLRESDVAGRYGGEEFLIILPETDSKEAKAVAERIREQVEGISIDAKKVPISISGGIAELNHGESSDDLLGNADENLYLAKAQGRNKVL